MPKENVNLQVLICVIGFSLCYTFRLRTLDIKLIVKEHNRYRKDLANGVYGVHAANMNKLTWSRYLQRRAENKVSCDRLQNDNENPYNFSVNFGVSNHRNYSEIIFRWFREIRYLLPEYGTCQYISQCRNFLTMSHADHYRIGCAASMCNNGLTSLLCLYKGARSIVPFYKSGEACTKCDGVRSFCNNGLCVRCDRSTECECRKTCNKPFVGLGHLDNTTCTCHCTYGLGPNCDEECQNPEQYVDYDICAEVTEENCATTDPEERQLYEEFCPEKCSCRRFPSAGVVPSALNETEVSN